MTDIQQQEYDLAGDHQEAIFLAVIDKRVQEFLSTAIPPESSSELASDLVSWAEDLRTQLRMLFSSWYGGKVRGLPVPRNVLIPAPRRDRVYKRYRAKLSQVPCQVCADTRVFHLAHIIPRAAGGPDDEWNLIRLCANHHYLFDQDKLSKREWTAVRWELLDHRAYEYVQQHRLPRTQKRWARQDEA